MMHLRWKISVATLLFFVIVVAPLSGINETNLSSEDKNFTSGRSNPDLTVDYLSASWTTADAGDTKSVSTRIKNEGDASSGSFSWGLYLSTDTTITTSDTQLDTWSQSSISAGSTRSSTKTITIPSSMTGGYYYVGMIVDINNQVSESDEGNNDDYDSGRVHVYELPDLVPRTTSSSCSTPSTGVIGDYLSSSISIQYENDVSSSHGQSTGIFYWAMYLSTDSTITTSDTQVGNDQYSSSLSAGNYRTDSLSSSNTIPSSLSAGTYYWGYILDVDSDVDEAIETNNVRTCNQITLQEDLPDLEAERVQTSSSSVIMGETISVSYRINNIGTDYSGSFDWALYLSTDSTITTSDIFVDEFSENSIAGGSYRSSTKYNVAIPASINPGYYYLGMIADSNADATELDESNNIVSSTSRIDVEEPADLEPQSLSGPTSAYSGDTVTLSYSIKNQGDDSSGWFYWKAYISSDQTITSSDTLLGSQNYESSISAGSTRTGSQSVTIPSSLNAGTYYFGIIVDTGDHVDEGDETNNILRGTSISITQAEPDLEADSFALDSSTRTICQGGSISYSLTVNNIGNVYASSHYYEIRLASSPSGIQFGTWLLTDYGSGNVPSYTHYGSTSIPSSVSPGNYYVGTIIDSSNTINEEDENNNIATTPSNGILTVEECKPDLVAVDVVGPSSAAKGDSVYVSYNIQNSGTANSGNFDAKLYLSTDSSISTTDVEIGTINLQGLNHGSTASSSLSVTIPTSISSGCWNWGLIVDPQYSVTELNEGNNIVSSTNQLCITQPDLHVVSITGPNQATMGQDVELSIVIENQGGSAAGAFSSNIFLSLDATLDGSDTQLGSFNINSLDSGMSTTITTTVRLPSGHSGQYYWGTLTDVHDDVDESLEENNAGTSSSIVTINSPTQDLVAISINGPTSAEPGQTIQLTWEIENLGTQDTQSFEIHFILSNDTYLSNDDQILSTYVMMNLEAGSSHEAQRGVTIPMDVLGAKYWIIYADALDNFEESDETNNKISSINPITIGTSVPEINNELPGCENPNNDGGTGIDSPDIKSAAIYLGSDIGDLEIDGCIESPDTSDWWAVTVGEDNQLLLALTVDSNSQFLLLIEEDSSEQVIGEIQNVLGETTLSFNTQGLDESNESRTYLIKVESISGGGAYKLRLVTSSDVTETDILSPLAPEIPLLEQWISEDTIVYAWPETQDLGPAGISHYEYRITLGTELSNWTIVSTNSTTISLSDLTDGKYALEVRAIDNANNIGASSAVWLKIDRTPPSLEVEQLDAQRSNPPVLKIDVVVDDGNGSGIREIVWSIDNNTWKDVPSDGLLVWSDWSELDLWVKVTDGAGSEYTLHSIVTPPDDETKTTETLGVESGDSNYQTPLIVGLILLTLILIGMVLRIARIRYGDYEDEEEDESQAAPSTQINSPQPQPIQHQPPTMISVESFEMLPPGGNYDYSTGATIYVDADGSNWQMQENGSFIKL